MTKLDKFEVLSILGADDTSTSYKIKNKETSEVFVWKAFAYDNCQEQQNLIEQIEKCMLKLEQPNSLHIHDYILYEDKKIVYITCEFCINGNLSNVIQTCRSQNFYLDEEFMWRLLYQLACILKQGVVEIKLNDIFLDTDFNIKLFRFRLQQRNNFAHIVKELSKFGRSHYTKELCDLIKFIEIGLNSVEAILSHPKALLKNCANAAVITDIYVKNPIVDDCIDGIDRVKLENLKNREVYLKQLEERLKEQEHKIHKREKKLALQERIVQEKIVKAELYLKRCRSNKQPAKLALEDIDTSFSANCGSVAPTQKLNSDNIKTNFTRTASERRVHFKGFKGHSPLKEIRWGKSEPTNSVSSGSKKTLFGKARPLSENNSRPISWTEEAKQHAYDLLRIMNNDFENVPVKHTYL